MSWDKLPCEIKTYILELRYNIRNDSANKIQKLWSNYILPDLTAIDIVLNLELDQYNYIMVSIRSTESILKKCLFITTGKHYLFFWKKLLHKIKCSLIIHEYNEEEWLTPEAVNYRKIKVVYEKLAKKFKLK